MKKNRMFSVIIAISIILISCEKNNRPYSCIGPYPGVYKFKEGINYIEYVPVLMDSTRARIIGYNTGQELEDIEKSIKYEYKGYYYGTVILNTGYLSVTYEEFNSMIDTLTDEDMMELLMERYPFESVYNDPDGYLIEEIYIDSVYHPRFDTLKFHHLVDNNEFELYLKKLL